MSAHLRVETAAGRRSLATLVAAAALAAGLGAVAGTGFPRAAAAPAPGCHQDGGVSVGVSVFGAGDARHAVTVQLPVCATGAVTVSFHSTAAACATGAPCGYAGTATWAPDPGGALILVGVRRAGGLRITGGSLFTGPLSTVHTLVTRTSRPAGTGTCRDRNDQFGGSLSVRPHAGLITVAVGAGRAAAQLVALLGSRCAGPTDGDVGSALPSVTLPLAAVRAGHATLDLSGTRTFTSRDFAGTVTSTLVLATGRARVTPVQQPGGTQRGARYRNLIEHYRVTPLEGRLEVAITANRAAQRCRALDACGARGRLSVAIRGRASASVYLNADGPAHRAPADFLAALGRGPGDPRGIRVMGGGTAPVSGNVTAHVRAPARCTDSAGFGNVSLVLSPRRGRMQVSLTAGFATGDPLRTRCPGPAAASHTLAAASVPLGALAAPTTTVILHGRRFADGPYAVHIVGTVSVTLLRRSTTVQIYRAPR